MLEVALRHRFGATALAVEFTAPTPGITALFGPSGAGKSSVLAAACGLLRPDQCRIVLDGDVLADTATGEWLPPERRRMGLVFQDARLFPHMNVAANLRFGLRRVRAGSSGSAPIRFDDVVGLLDIGRLLDRRPHHLSGGERQRVAIGRALLSQPRLLLMDEPLASLDAARKAEIMPFLIRLDATLRVPVLYVTHAIEEVARLARTIVLLQAGEVVAAGDVSAMSGRPDLPLARRDDAAAVLDAEVEAHDPVRHLSRLRWGATGLLVPLQAAGVGTTLRLRIPAREIILARADLPSLGDAISLHNILPGTVRAMADDPERGAVLVELATEGGALLASITPDAVDRLGLRHGNPALALVKAVSVEVLG